MKFRCRVTRDYYHEGYVEVEACCEEKARELALGKISDADLKIGDELDNDMVHEIEPVEEKQNVQENQETSG